LYCNTICPVGALLGELSRHAFLRLEIDATRCFRCGDCLQTCKAQCIDLRKQHIDFARCVGCYNCLSACDRGAIGFRARQAKVGRPAAKPVRKIALPLGSERREFLCQAGLGLFLGLIPGQLWAELPDRAAEPRPSRSFSPFATPPGSQSVKRYLSHCTGCHLCVASCPTRILQPAKPEWGLGDGLKPRLNFGRSYCHHECTACGEVCPTGAITRLTSVEKRRIRIGLAQLDVEKCRICPLCTARCPTQAITQERIDGSLTVPVVHLERCIGCGLCEAVCPPSSRAIKVAALVVHEPLEDQSHGV
jgi:ferredoxin